MCGLLKKQNTPRKMHTISIHLLLVYDTVSTHAVYITKVYSYFEQSELIAYNDYLIKVYDVQIRNKSSEGK